MARLTNSENIAGKLIHFLFIQSLYSVDMTGHLDFCDVYTPQFSFPFTGGSTIKCLFSATMSSFMGISVPGLKFLAVHL